MAYPGWNPIFWGVREELPIATQLRIRLANMLALVLLAAMVGSLGVIRNPYVMELYAVAIGFMILVPVLNWLGQDLGARFLLSLIGPILFLLVGTSPKIRDIYHEQFFRLFIFGLVFIPMSVFSGRERYYQVVTVALIAAAYFLYPWVDSIHNVYNRGGLTYGTGATVALVYAGPLILLVIFVGSFAYFQSLENRSTQDALQREREANRVLREQETKLATAAEQADRAYQESKASEKALLAKNAELAQQTERLEEARENMRRLIKRLRTGQVQLEEQQAMLAERQFIDAGLAHIVRELRYQPDTALEDWGRQVVAALLKQLEGSVAVLYLLEGQFLRVVSEMVPTGVQASGAVSGFSLGQGSVGAAALRGQPLITKWPDTLANGHSVETSLFSVKPSEVYTLPLLFNQDVIGVLEVTCLSSLSGRQRDFLMRVPEVIGPGMHAFLAQLEIKRLLIEAQQKTETLMSQEEELRQNIEELEATQENMRQAQQQLRNQEATLNAVMDATSDSIVLVDRQYNMVIANRTMRERYRKYGIELKMGANAFDSMPDKSYWELWKGVYHRVFGGTAESFTSTRVDEGITRHVEYVVNPVYNAEHEIIGASVFSRDVTERVEAENAIKASEQKLRELNETLEDMVALRTQEVSLNASILSVTLDTTMDGILVMDASGRVLRFNQQFLEMWGISPEEESRIYRDSALPNILPKLENPDAFERHVLEVEAQNPPHSEYILHTSDGRVFRVFSKQPSEESTEVGRVWGFSDITNLYRTEQNLRESEIRFRRFFELAQEGLVFHENGIVTDLNPSIAAMFGVKIDEGIGAEIINFIHPEDRIKALAYMQRGDESLYEIRVVSSDGRELTCEVVGRNLEIDGRMQRAVAIRDITERIQAENQFIAIARANPLPLLMFRYSDATILYANEHFEHLLGYIAEEFVGGPSKALYYYEEDKQRMRDLMRVTGGRLENFEVCAKKKTGEPVWVVVSSERVRFRGEDAVIISFYDITERRAFEQSIIEAKKQVEEAFAKLKEARDQLALSEKLASLGQIIAGVAHEINTPVAAVGSSAVFMQENMPHSLREFVDLLLKFSKKEGDLLAQFVADLYGKRKLISSREERNLRKDFVKQLEKTTVESAEEAARLLVQVGFQKDLTPYLPLLKGKFADRVIQVVSGVGQNFYTLENLVVAADKTRTIVSALKRFTYLGQRNEEDSDEAVLRPISLQDNLNTILILYSHQIRKSALLNTHFDGDLFVVADGDRLGQVWTNLITNALQAMPGGGELSVELLDGHCDGKSLPGMVVVRVADTGSGIPEHVLPKIFDPFFTTKPKGEGSGIGLHISRQIVEGYGGSISVESRPGRTAFTILLPKAEAPPIA